MELAIGKVDLAVLCLYTLVAVVLGITVGRGQRDLSGYLLGGRNMPWWAILGSIVATETSTATFLSIPGVAYAKATGDLGWLQLTFGYILGRLLIVYLLLPLYFKGQLFTAYQVLQERFGGATKRIASLIFLVTRNLGDGLRLFLAAIALQHVVGWPLPACIVAMGAITIVYTVFGGMKSVVWNDCLQLVIYMVGGVIAFSVILDRLPEGWATLQAYGVEHQKFQILDWSLAWDDPYTVWAGLLGGMFLTLGTHGTDQMMVQRYLCARSQREAGWALVASGFVVLLQFALFLMLGVGLACFYDVHDPGRTFEKTDRVFAAFIVEEMPANVGLVGLLLAGVFAAAMSTLSSSLNSSASAVVNDFLSAHNTSDQSPASANRLVWLSRVLTVVFGVLQIGIAIAADSFSETVVSDSLAIAGFSAGLLLGVFCLGVLTKSVDQRACLVGLVAGLSVLLTIKFLLPPVSAALMIAWHCYSQNFGEVIFEVVLPGVSPGIVIAWPWYSLIGSTSTFITGIVAARAIPKSRVR